MYNTIVTVCHLVSDPELKEISGGKKVCKMRVCVSSSNAKTKNFIDAEAWDRQAEICSQYLKKGREVLIQGELCMDSWEKDGKKASKHFIRVGSIQFLGGNGDGKKDTNPNAATTTTQSTASLSPFEDEIPF
jgi:single-strand DNA-binding protein